VFGNRVLRGIFGSTMHKVTAEWMEELHNEDLHILHSSPNIIRHMKSRRMRWEGHVACMGQERKLYKVLWERSKERGHLEDRDVNGGWARIGS
jgi:hypothetical protein